jgi:hypothetical protein
LGLQFNNSNVVSNAQEKEGVWLTVASLSPQTNIKRGRCGKIEKHTKRENKTKEF